MPRNILLIWDRMGDYHRARWRALQQLAGSKREVHAADLAGQDNLYKWSTTEGITNYHTLSDRPLSQIKTSECLQSFLKIIRSNDIQLVCIPGYGRLVYMLMLLLARWRGLKVLMFAESWYPSSFWRTQLKRRLLRNTVDVFFVSGIRAEAHFISKMGIPPKKIKIGYSVVDNAHFQRQSGSPEREKILLCVARFAPEKNLETLIEAFQSSTLSTSWRLVIIGGGPLKNKLIRLSSASSSIELIDWVTYQDLPDYYHRASCFILPSRFEPWGLVVNEAMAAGLPVIVSEEVGAEPDLVNEENGWIFPAQEERALIRVLDCLHNTSKGALYAMGDQSKKRIQEFSVNHWARQILDAFQLSIH